MLRQLEDWLKYKPFNNGLNELYEYKRYYLIYALIKI